MKGYAVAVDEAGSAYITGYTYSTDLATSGAAQSAKGDSVGWSDAFVLKLSRSPLDERAVRVPGHCTCQDHPVSPTPNTIRPVNTRSGNFWTQLTDLALQSPGPALAWTRTYASQALTDTTGVLGYGWQHPFAARLIAPTMTGGETGKVIIISPEGNQLRYADRRNGLYQAIPGVYSTLVSVGSVYTQTLRDQQQWVFDASDGRLLTVQDAQGRQLALTYSGTPARLDQIADANDATRYLALSYTSGRISSVSDGARSVAYTYDASGNLIDAADVMTRHTTYRYQTPASHLLTTITNALGQDVERIGYDALTPPRVITQTLQEQQQLQFTYLVTATLLTTTGADGQPDVQEYDYAADNSLTGMRHNGQAVLATTFNDSFSPGLLIDGNGNPTTTRYRTDGLPLETTNALGQTAQGLYDAHNQLVQTTDAQGITSRFRYDAANNVISTTVGITATSPLRATTLYTYTAGSQLLEQRGPDGVITRNAYDAQGQVISATIGYGTPLRQTTTYGYDALGRVVTTTVGFGTPLARSDVTRYNADNTVAKSIQNYTGSGNFTAAFPDRNITASYGYDHLGRTVAVTDTLGHVDVSHYDAQGRVD
jgi:YD repeat-containing protein